MGKKIRNAELMKIPYTVVVGEKELKTNQVSPRVRSDLAVKERKDEAYSYESFIKSVSNEVRSRAQNSSL